MLRVLTYHRVANPADTPDLDPVIVSATPEVFRRQMLHLRKCYHPVGMAEVEGAFLEGRSLPRRAVHVTVDDAYRDFGDVAWPILRELGIPVTVFVPTGYPGAPHRAFWWDRLHRAVRDACWQDAEWAPVESRLVHGVAATGRGVRAWLRTLPHDELERFVDAVCAETGRDSPSATVLSWEELRGLAREGVTFGSHTRNHVGLSHVDEARARAEIRESLEDLAGELGTRPRVLAYPYGIHDANVARWAREEGCSLAFTTQDGLNHPGRTDPLRLRRTNITPRTTPSVFAVRMLSVFAHVDRLRHGVERRQVSV